MKKLKWICIILIIVVVVMASPTVPTRVKNQTYGGGNQGGAVYSLGDWFYLNPDWFTVSGTNNVISIDSSITPSDYLQVGDKVKIVQGGSTKYFYVIFTDDSANTVTVNAGSDYTFGTINNPTSVEFSRATNPEGHPLKFNDSVSVQAESAGMTTVFGSATVEYSMIGNRVLYSGNVSATFGGSAGGDFSIDYPFGLRSVSTNRADHVVYLGDTNDTNIESRIARLIVGRVNADDRMFGTKIDNSVFIYAGGNGQLSGFFSVSYHY